MPNENKYREISSASYFHDFQTRRLNIRYKDENGKLRFAHSLNSTAILTPRIIVSIAENYQQADGSILAPEVLRKYIGKEKFRKYHAPRFLASSMKLRKRLILKAVVVAIIFTAVFAGLVAFSEYRICKLRK